MIMKTTRREHLAITVAKDKEFESRVTIIRVKPELGGSLTEDENYKDITAERVNNRIARVTGNECLWTKVETAKNLKATGSVLVEGMTQIGRAVVMLNVPKRLKGVWELVGDENKMKELEAANPQVKIYEILVDAGEWETVEKITEVAGVYTLGIIK